MSSYLYTDSPVPGQGGSDLPLNWKSEALASCCCFSSSTFISGIGLPGIGCSRVPTMKWHREVTHARCPQQACESRSPLAALKRAEE